MTEAGVSPARARSNDSGSSEAAVVAEQRPFPQVAVEDQRADPGDLRQRCLQGEAPSPHGLSQLRAVRGPRRPATGAGELTSAAMSRIHDLLTELGIIIDPQLYELAVTHRSWAYENGGVPTNERLEFLGDAVLGLVVTEHLYRSFPDRPEGVLAKLRAAVVNSQSLATVARELEIGGDIRLGRGELTTGGRNKASILADTVEALIGAVLLSGGIEQARVFVHHVFDPLVEAASSLGAGLDWKTSLQELCAELGLGVPGYQVAESGPDHDKRFAAYVRAGEGLFGPGKGLNKKQAEQQAAAMAFTALREAADATEHEHA